jgi:hypothetical protein
MTTEGVNRNVFLIGTQGLQVGINGILKWINCKRSMIWLSIVILQSSKVSLSFFLQKVSRQLPC